MASPTHLKSLRSRTIFSLKSPYSSSLGSTKLKTLVRTLIFTYLRHIVHTSAKAKSSVAQLFNHIQLNDFINYLKKVSNKQKKCFFGSFRFHYNWGSSRALPVPSHVLDVCHVYYNPAWDSMVSVECNDVAEAALSEYLRSLEEEKFHENSISDYVDDINKKADMFIASGHEKFKLEKEESYRRFQEMMARSV